MKVLIVDDEPLAREVLLSFLRRDPEVTLIEECSDGAEAMGKMDATRFDLVFLDIRMPDMDGFSVLSEFPSRDRPLIIFVTAYEEHALRAFSVAALDYLLKPFDDRRFATAMERAKQRLRERELTRRGRELVELIGEAVDPRPRPGERIAIQSGGSVLRVELSAVLWIEAQDKHVLFHTEGQPPFRARQTLSEIEHGLDPRQFLRVHRSCIVALSHVSALEKTEGGAAYVTLDSGDRVVVSRSRLPVLRSRIQQSSP